jgi:hypothetical protein
MKSASVLGAVLIGFACDSFAENKCLRYDEEIVGLRGILQIRVFFGPPNFGENPNTDSRETQAGLFLDKAICTVKEEGSDDTNEANQIELTLVPNQKVRLSNLAGKKVIVSGKLFGALTGHHHTPLLLSLSNISQ